MNKNKETVAIINSPQNAGLVKILAGDYADIVYFPEVTYKKIARPQNARLISTSPAFDWIVFMDPISTAGFLDEFEGLGNDPFELDKVQILSAGDAVADRLRFRQVHSDLIAPFYGIPAALEQIRGYLQVRELKAITLLCVGLNFAGAATIVPEPENGLEILYLELVRAEVRKIEAARLRALIAAGSVDRFIIGGARDLIDLLSVFGLEDFLESLSGVILEPHGDASEMLLCLRNSEIGKFNHPADK